MSHWFCVAQQTFVYQTFTLPSSCGWSSFSLKPQTHPPHPHFRRTDTPHCPWLPSEPHVFVDPPFISNSIWFSAVTLSYVNLTLRPSRRSLKGRGTFFPPPKKQKGRGSPLQTVIWERENCPEEWGWWGLVTNLKDGWGEIPHFFTLKHYCVQSHLLQGESPAFLVLTQMLESVSNSLISNYTFHKQTDPSSISGFSLKENSILYSTKNQTLNIIRHNPW